jgi:vacuolar-type H+-ATPase subunit I/STV1
VSQLACPLCGRFVSLNGFDPSNFESDIYAVNRTGLGRGRGFAVSESFSVLGDLTITGPIALRCRKILGLIEGRVIPSSNDVSVLTLEVEKWKREALRIRKDVGDLYAKMAELEGTANYWRREAQTLQRIRNEKEAQLASNEEMSQRWSSHSVNLENEVRSLKSRISKLDQLEEEKEEEMLASEEMEEILDMINSSANTDFEYLIDAVEFLLEGG